MKLHPQYVVDEHGQQTGVLLPLAEYRRLLEALEDQLDAADLDEAVADETEFAGYDEVRDQLRAEGKL
jgi:PHD/YefM family antitoxin component YafN of YafNO toxin-antitoxin module